MESSKRQLHDAGGRPGAIGPWSVCWTAPGAIDEPSRLDGAALQWFSDAPVPGTAAQAMRDAGQWNFGTPLDFDARDWWYRAELIAGPARAGSRSFLHFHGLATLADVWLNGQHLLASDNMFKAHCVEIGALLRPGNEIVIRFRSLAAELEKRRARPRWKTRLVRHQQLRWLRTTLLGRIPGWSPPVQPVGPWRAVILEERRDISLADIVVRPSAEGQSAVLEFSAMLPLAGGRRVTARLILSGTSHDLAVEHAGGAYRLSGRVVAPNLALWWPHTHGQPALHECTVEVLVDGDPLSVNLGRLGFKRIEADGRNGDFRLHVNGTAVFCRGACWTASDIVTLNSKSEDLAHVLRLAQRAGMNMVRIGGTMVYEQDDFYRICDELGILVWQDFMFANMDYPIDDETFRASIESEARQQLGRWRRHACLAVYCGSSEVEQQAAMLGMPRELWRNTWFSTLLPAICREIHPEIPYVPSTPSGGDLPFHVGTGLAHYYGVGAYLRSVAQVRRDNVRFTPECLGFSNVPEPGTVERLFDGDSPATHHPRWKERVPRDSGTGWDFEDVRDHYLGVLFGIDPIRLRAVDTPRYLALSRVTSGEMMSQVFSEWRSANSRCGGGLVWFFQDLWPGAGWGILDSHGLPKACYYYLRRAWQPRTVLLTDEGLDGIQAHVVNETDKPLSGTLELLLLKDGSIAVGKARVECQVAARSTVRFAADAMLDGFYDVSYVYRFGPPKHDVVCATLLDAQGAIVGESFHFTKSNLPADRGPNGVVAVAEPLDDGGYRVAITSETFLQAVHIDTQGYLPEDNYFSLVPGRRKTIDCRPLPGAPVPFKAYVEALNIHDPVRVNVAK